MALTAADLKVILTPTNLRVRLTTAQVAVQKCSETTTTTANLPCLLRKLTTTRKDM